MYQFRAKALVNGDWVYGGVVETSKHTYIVPSTIEITGNELVADVFVEVDDSTVGQYIGRKDKLGARIFVGDKLLARSPDEFEETGYSETHSVVVNTPNGFGLLDECGELDELEYVSFENDEVVGTIFD